MGSCSGEVSLVDWVVIQEMRSEVQDKDAGDGDRLVGFWIVR